MNDQTSSLPHSSQIRLEWATRRTNSRPQRRHLHHAGRAVEDCLKRRGTRALTNRYSFIELFRRGDFSTEFYAPKDIDLQQPHEQDEVYFVASGSGSFVRGEERVSFERGDFLFVPAGVVHHFEEFSDDFSTWVIFFGPKGGFGS